MFSAVMRFLVVMLLAHAVAATALSEATSETETSQTTEAAETTWTTETTATGTTESTDTNRNTGTMEATGTTGTTETAGTTGSAGTTETTETAGTTGTTEAPEVETTAPKKLCSICDCNGPLLDCSYQYERYFPITHPDAWSQDVEEATFYCNQLTSVGKIPPLPELRLLSFGFNFIQKIEPGAFVDLPKLEELDLSQNSLSSLQIKPKPRLGSNSSDYRDYQPLRNLKVLRLEFNKLTDLSEDFFDFVPNLRELSLANNDIDVLSLSLHSLVNLESLDMSAMGISWVPTNLLQGLVNLTSLDFSYNELWGVPTFYQKLPQLKELRLSNNPIDRLYSNSFDDSLSTLESLVMTDMSNLWYVAAGTFSQLPELRSLVLTGCLSLFLDQEAFVGHDYGKPALEQLVLRNNGLRKLDFELLPTWKNMRVLDLQFNFWECDCDLAWISALEPIVDLTPELKHGVQCSEPQYMEGVNVFSNYALQNTGRVCWGSYVYGVEIALIVGTVLVTLLILAFLYRECVHKHCCQQP